MRWLRFSLCLLSLCVFLSSLPGVAFSVDVGTCRRARTESEEKRSPHIFFTVDTGRSLLLELKGLRKDKERFKLIEGKLKLDKEIEGWYKLQIAAAEKTVDKMSKDLALKRQQLLEVKSDLSKANVKINKLTIDVATYKGQRYQWLMYGVGGTVIVFVVGIIVYGVVNIAVSK